MGTLRGFGYWVFGISSGYKKNLPLISRISTNFLLILVN